MSLMKAGLGLGLGLLSVLGSAAWAKDVVIHAGKLLDGVTATPQTEMSIVIHDQRITSIAKGFIAPAGAEVIDLSKATVLPGLIDTHVHITHQLEGGNPIANRITHTDIDTAYRSVAYAHNTLLAGFTTVRDVGAATRVIVGLKKAISEGRIDGPRLFVAGVALGPTGGHSDPLNGIDPELSHPHWDESTIDGPEDAMKKVRAMRRDGVNLIKIMPSGGVLSIGDDPSHTTMTDAEIEAVVTTAHALGMKVAAHAHGKDAILRAARLGVDSIEHGSYADAEAYKVMKEHGTYLVPTLLVADTAMQVARAHPEQLNPSAAEKAMQVAPLTLANAGAAYKAGVKIAFGTDQGLSPHGQNAKEFALMVKAGISASDAIFAATRNAAELIGDTADIGSIQAGRYADIIAVTEDPLADITALERVAFVMKGGNVEKTK